MKENIKCIICGTEIRDYGNNPYPITNGVEDRCCEICNCNIVIPTRMYIAVVMRDDSNIIEQHIYNKDNEVNLAEMLCGIQGLLDEIYKFYYEGKWYIRVYADRDGDYIEYWEDIETKKPYKLIKRALM